MLRVLENGSIEVSRGDTGNLTIGFGGDMPPDGTEALVTVKKSPQKHDVLWEKRLTVQDGQIDIRLNREDTNHAAERYFWDVRLLGGGEISTPTLPMPFVVLEAVGNV